MVQPDHGVRPAQEASCLGAVDVLCECGRDDCTETIEFTQPQFDAILRDNDSVLIATEHADGIGGRRVLAENGRFLVVAAE
jgi:hypothetical protein